MTTSTAPPYWPSAVELGSSHSENADPGPMQDTYFERLWRTRAKGDNGPVTVHEPPRGATGSTVSNHDQRPSDVTGHPKQHPHPSEVFPRDQIPAQADPSKQDEASSTSNANWSLTWSNQGAGPFPRLAEESPAYYQFASPDTSNRFSQLLKAKLAAEQPREPAPYTSYPPAQSSQPPYPSHLMYAPGLEPPLAPQPPWALGHQAQLERPPQQYPQWGPSPYPPPRSHLHPIPLGPDNQRVDLHTLQPVPLSASPWAQMNTMNTAHQCTEEDRKPQIHEHPGHAPYVPWGQPHWNPGPHGPPMWHPPSAPNTEPIPSKTPTLTHRSCDSVDSVDPPITPLNSIDRLPLVDPTYEMKPHSAHPPMITASDMPANGDMGGGGYIGVGQNPSGSVPNGNGSGDLPSGFGDQGDMPGDGGAGGSGDDGQDDQNGAPPTGIGRKRIKLPLACHFCRRRKLKCDGKRPDCDNCTKRGETCIYDEAVRRRGPGKRTKEMRDKAAREAEEAGMTNPNSASGVAGPSTLDPADFSGVIDDQNLNVDGMQLHGHEYEGDGAVMDAMDAVIGAGINLDMADEGAIHMARVGIEGIEGLADHNDLIFPEPSTLAELGAIDPSLRSLGAQQRHPGQPMMGNLDDMKGKKRKLEEQGYGDEHKAKVERQG